MKSVIWPLVQSRIWFAQSRKLFCGRSWPLRMLRNVLNDGRIIYQNNLTMVVHSKDSKIRTMVLHRLTVRHVDHKDVLGGQGQRFLEELTIFGALIA